LPARIEALEAEQKSLGDQLSGTAIYSGDAQVLAQTQARFSQIENELTEALERWEALSSR
jgi:ATP-binding cassette subfamily F protein uup